MVVVRSAKDFEELTQCSAGAIDATAVSQTGAATTPAAPVPVPLRVTPLYLWRYAAIQIEGRRPPADRRGVAGPSGSGGT